VCFYKPSLITSDGTDFDTDVVAMGVLQHANVDERDPDDGEAPETPTDEPRPPEIKDPPPQPDKGPYVVMQEAV